MILPTMRMGRQRQFPKLFTYISITLWIDLRKKVKRLDHRYPTRLEESEYRKQPPARTKEGYFNKQHARIDTASAETNLHN